VKGPRGGYRLGHGKIIDHMFLDGLEDAYDKGRLMGTFAEDCAQKYSFSRSSQDDFAIASLQRIRGPQARRETIPPTHAFGRCPAVRKRLLIARERG